MLDHEMIKRRLEMNKVRLLKKDLIARYQNMFGVSITDDMFVDQDESTRIRRTTYRKFWYELSGERVFTNEELFSLLSHLRWLCAKHMEQRVWFSYFREEVKTGGVLLPLRTCWEIITKIGEPVDTILVVEMQFAFGFGVELEEHYTTITSWGL